MNGVQDRGDSKCHSVIFSKVPLSLLAFIALSAAQSSAQTRIHNAILVIDTSNNASYNQVHWLVHLSIKASNELEPLGHFKGFLFWGVLIERRFSKMTHRFDSLEISIIQDHFH